MRVKAPQGATLHFRVAGPDGEAALAAMLALVHDGFGEVVSAVTEIHLTGRAASPGLAIGPVTMLTAAVAQRGRRAAIPRRRRRHCGRRLKARAAEIAELIETSQGEAADILEFQVAMLEDDALAEGAYRRHLGGHCCRPCLAFGTRRRDRGLSRRRKMNISVPVPRTSSISATACSRI